MLQTRLSVEDKQAIQAAARLRRLPVSDYLRQVLVPIARREVTEAEQDVIGLSPDEQLALWQALEAPVSLTKAQRKLARLMKGEV